MTKSRVKVTEIQPGMLLYRPEHKSGVLAAIKDFCKGKTPRVRKQGIEHRISQRKRTTGQRGASDKGYAGNIRDNNGRLQVNRELSRKNT